MKRLLPTVCVAALAFGPAARAQAPAAAAPVFHLEANGPTALVTALAFAPDGKTLYAAGFDKVVRTWVWDEPTAQFRPGEQAFRVPIGPGRAGALNALAVSPDGRWLATGGIGLMRNVAGFRAAGG